MARLYVIGDKDTGVLFIKTQPLRMVVIPAAEIQRYATDEGTTFEDIFGRLAASAKQVVTMTEASPSLPPLPGGKRFFDEIQNLIAVGGRLSDVEFCYVAELEEAAGKEWSATRYSVPPIKTSMSLLSPEADALATGAMEIPVGPID